MRRDGVGGQLGRFLAVGALSTALQYLVLIAGVRLLGAGALLASGVGFLLSSAANYLLNRRYTWASGIAHRIAVGRFAGVVMAGLALNLLGMRLLHDHLGWHYLLAQVVTTCFVLSWNFAWHRLWTFSVPSPSRGR